MTKVDLYDYKGYTQRKIPNNTRLDVVVVGGFVGIKKDTDMYCCEIDFEVVTPGFFCGRKQSYAAKIFSSDDSNRCMAYDNLKLIDEASRFPIRDHKLDLTTDSIKEYWAHRGAKINVNFKLFEKMDGGLVNFITPCDWRIEPNQTK